MARYNDEDYVSKCCCDEGCLPSMELKQIIASLEARVQQLEQQSLSSVRTMLEYDRFREGVVSKLFDINAHCSDELVSLLKEIGVDCRISEESYFPPFSKIGESLEKVSIVITVGGVEKILCSEKGSKQGARCLATYGALEKIKRDKELLKEIINDAFLRRREKSLSFTSESGASLVKM